MENKEIIKKNIPLFLALTILTLGIFGIYWQYNILKDTYFLLEKDDNALFDIILIILTFGIYGLFVWYKISMYLYKLSQKLERNYEPNSTLFVVLSLFHLSFIICFISQTELNYYLGEST